MVKPKLKRKSRSDKFPLTIHPTGQYCKRIGGKLYYFGADKQQALERYLENAASLHSGAGWKPSASDGMPVKDLCNLYLEHQHTRVRAGEIKPSQVSDQTRVLKRFVIYLGSGRLVHNISTLDLQNYRSKLIKEGKSAARMNNHISAFKAMFNWAVNNEVVYKVPNLSAIKKLPKPNRRREVFTADEVSKLLAHATPNMRAMIWLGLNCGFGCTDCSELSWDHVDLRKKRICFARTKTGVARDLPLWPETITALRAIPRKNKRVFNTKYGNAYVRFKEKIDANGALTLVKCDNVTSQFARLMKKAGVRKAKGTGFYTLRRTAATLAAKSGDPFAVQRLLGHTDLKMASTYVQNVSEQTDRVVGETRKLIVQDNS